MLRELAPQELAVLLREAEQAHGLYEKSLGHADDDWPTWYAKYILKKLRKAPGGTQNIF